MVTILLLTIIYLAFISLGLPDAIFGVAWPVIREDYSLSLDNAGYISVTITIGTVMSSLLSGYLIDKLGTGKITLISVGLTAIALFGFGIAPSFYWLILLAFPLGFGGGSIDTALNNYVAVHFKAHHMNWLHSFWGIGATLGPVIMSATLALNVSWQNGYKTLSYIQLVFFILIFLSLPLWKKHNKLSKDIEDSNLLAKPSFKKMINIKGVKFSLLAFIIYTSMEFSVGLWGASYLVSVQTITITIAASLVASYYLGITVGRVLAGFVSFKLSNIQMIFYGILIFLAATIFLLFKIPNYLLFMVFFIQGIGLAPIFPAMIHETPKRFGKDKSQYIIGYQMACAYFGASVFPAIFGIFAKNTSLYIYPYFLIISGILLIYNTHYLNKQTKKTV